LFLATMRNYPSAYNRFTYFFLVGTAAPTLTSFCIPVCVVVLSIATLGGALASLSDGNLHAESC